MCDSRNWSQLTQRPGLSAALSAVIAVLLVPLLRSRVAWAVPTRLPRLAISSLRTVPPVGANIAPFAVPTGIAPSWPRIGGLVGHGNLIRSRSNTVDPHLEHASDSPHGLLLGP